MATLLQWKLCWGFRYGCLSLLAQDPDYGAFRMRLGAAVVRIGDTLVIAKKTHMNQQVERSLVPMVLTPAALVPVKPQVLHPRLAELWLIRCQTSLNSLIYGATFGHYVRVTDSAC